MDIDIDLIIGAFPFFEQFDTDLRQSLVVRSKIKSHYFEIASSGFVDRK